MAADDNSPSTGVVQTPAPGIDKLDFTSLKFLVVGKEQKRFAVRTCYLTRSSKYLRAACKNEWSHGNTIGMSEESPDLVETYIQWLYTGTLFVLPAEEFELCCQPDSANRNRLAVKAFTKLFADYKLGTFLCDDRYCNTVIDQLLCYHRHTYRVCPAEMLNRVCGGSLVTSTLGKLVIDQAIYSLNPAHMHRNMDRGLYSYEALQTIAKEACLRARSGQEPVPVLKAERCKYHDHDEETPKCTGPRPWLVPRN